MAIIDDIDDVYEFGQEPLKKKNSFICFSDIELH